eukprot:SAG11_NODE_1574_length_4659_cov_4.583333_8_plen_47_part_00
MGHPRHGVDLCTHRQPLVQLHRSERTCLASSSFLSMFCSQASLVRP